MNDTLQTAFIIILIAVIPLLWYQSWRSRRRLARRIDAQAAVIRILTEPPEPPDLGKPRHGLTLHQGGRAGAAILPVPLLWLLRYRPRPTALVATGVAMGIAYSAVTAIAVPPSTRPGAAPYRELVIPAAAGPTPSASSPPTVSPTAPHTAPSRATQQATATGSAPPAQPATPTPSTRPPASPTPSASSPPRTTRAPNATATRCLVTVNATGIITVSVAAVASVCAR